MIRTLAILATAFAFGATAPSAQAGELLVAFEDGTTRAERTAVLAEAAATPADPGTMRARELAKIDVVVVEAPGAALTQAQQALREMPEVAAATVPTKPLAQWAPNDPHFGSQWYLGAIRAPEAWDIERGSYSSTIAIVDNGIDPQHEDLAQGLVLGPDFVDNDWDHMNGAECARVQCASHGTPVASTAAGITNNSLGVAGVAPANRVVGVRSTGPSAFGTSGTAAGVVWAADFGAAVINLSLGWEQDDETLRRAIDYANAKGAVVVCSAGNQDHGYLLFPARYAGCLAVTAVDRSLQRANEGSWASNVGAGMGIAAPGVGGYAAKAGGGYAPFMGTSMAAPVVSGVAGLLASRGMTRAQILATLQGTARDLGTPGYDTTFGWGLVDAAAALGVPRSAPAAPAAPAPTPSAATHTTSAGGGATVASEDTQAPTRPRALRAKKLGARAVQLTWGRSADDRDRKVKYVVFLIDRKGKPRRVGATYGRSFRHAAPPRGRTLVYEVNAFDAAFNISPTARVKLRR